jgi:hypothetical protein
VRIIQRSRYSQLHVPNQPVRADCEACQAERDFRVFSDVQFTHIGYLCRWDYVESPHLRCSVCEHSIPLSVRDMRKIFPFYQPTPDVWRKRVVFALVSLPVVAYVIWWNVNRYLLS